MGLRTDKSKHLNYRLWIAEMNYYINVLRIFDDYLADSASERNKPARRDEAESFKRRFLLLRKEMDDLKHEMHLAKMKVAALLRDLSGDREKSESQSGLKKSFLLFREKFKDAEKEFRSWLNQ